MWSFALDESSRKCLGDGAVIGEGEHGDVYASCDLISVLCIPKTIRVTSKDVRQKGIPIRHISTERERIVVIEEEWTFVIATIDITSPGGNERRDDAETGSSVDDPVNKLKVLFVGRKQIECASRELKRPIAISVGKVQSAAVS